MTRSAPQTHDTTDDLGWIRTVLGGTEAGRHRPYLVRPSAKDPQLLLPLRPRAAARAGLRRNHDDRPVKERLMGLAGQQLALAGALGIAGGDTLHLGSFSLIDELATALGEGELIPVIGLGPPRRNRKPVVQLVRPDGVTVGFAKIGWSTLTKQLIRNEAAWLQRVDGRLPSTLRSPAVLHQATFATAETGAGREEFSSVDVVVTAPLRTSVLSRRKGPLSLETVAAVARLESSGLQTVAETPMIRSWRSSPLVDLVDLDQLVNRHGSATVELGMWHGDLTPWNTATVRGISSVWDWEFADQDRPVGFDALHLLFESERRSGPRREQAAIDRLVNEASSVLEALPGKTVTTSVDAVIDLYLCELLAREARLAGEGWTPKHLGQLDDRLRLTIQQRLDRA